MSYTSKVGIHCNKAAYEKLKKHLNAYPPTKTKTFVDEYYYLEWFWEKWDEDEDERVKGIMNCLEDMEVAKGEYWGYINIREDYEDSDFGGGIMHLSNHPDYNLVTQINIIGEIKDLDLYKEVQNG